jgi:hypothetical protein
MTTTARASTAIIAATFVLVAGKSTAVEVYVGAEQRLESSHGANVSSTDACVAIARKLGSILAGRGISTTVFDIQEPEEARVGRIATRGGGVYVGLTCSRASTRGARIRHLRMPRHDLRHEPEATADPGVAISKLMAVEGAKNGARLAQLISDRFSSHGLPTPTLSPCVGHYGLDHTAGAAVVVDLAAGTAAASWDFWRNGGASAAIAEAVAAFLDAGSDGAGHPARGTP